MKATKAPRTAGKVFVAAVCASGGALCLGLLGCREENPPEWTRLPAELTVEVAKTPEETARGLKFRQNLPQNQGMYFVFEKEQQLSFYMRDTRIPLSIAFIRSDGVIESMRDMIPLDERSVTSAGPARFALEINRGWFEENAIRPGDRVVLEGNRVVFFRRAAAPSVGERRPPGQDETYDDF